MTTKTKKNQLITIVGTLSVKSNTIVASSLDIANYFEKRHTHVINTLEKIIKETDADFSQPNFRLAKYKDQQGKPRKSYQMTKDGFVLLVMNFSGAKAQQKKIEYINAFNQMQKTLTQQHIKAIEVEHKFKQVPEEEELSNYLIQEAVALDDALQGIRNMLMMTTDRRAGFNLNTRIINFKAIISQLKMIIKQVNLIIRADYDRDITKYAGLG